jgi:hypothetical protein
MPISFGEPMNKSCIVPLIAIAAFSFVCTAETKDPTSTEALLQARTYKYQFRSGQYDVVPRAIHVLETAVKVDPENIDLLTELGTAYLMRLTATSNPGGRAEDRQPAMQGAWDTFSRAAELDPQNAYAITGRGMSRIILSGRSPHELKAGIADMKTGVELDPTSLPARLMRTFTLLALPRELRDPAQVESDLEFLVNVARGTKAEEVLSLLTADVYFESGRRDAAARQYEHLAQTTSFAGDEARARLQALQKNDQDLATPIAQLRANLGRQCTMCHGK